MILWKMVKIKNSGFEQGSSIKLVNGNTERAAKYSMTEKLIMQKRPIEIVVDVKIVQAFEKLVHAVVDI